MFIECSASSDPNAPTPPRLRELVKRAAPKGVDVVFDNVGGEHFDEALKAVKWGAHILVIGFASGRIPQIAANVALVKNLTVHGVFWGSYMKHDAKVCRLRGSLNEAGQHAYPQLGYNLPDYIDLPNSAFVGNWLDNYLAVKDYARSLESG
jgi:NADPH-dependent curcumin reductase CurA